MYATATTALRSQHTHGQPRAVAGEGLDSAGSLFRGRARMQPLPRKPWKITGSSRLAAPSSLEISHPKP